MPRHLVKCAYPEAKSVAAVIRIRVDVPGTPYWLDLDINPVAPLSELDDFLREIWLECCDHLSSFEIGRMRYDAAPHGDFFGMGGPAADGMNVRASRALPAVGEVFSYEYDFGSTTQLRLKVIAHHQAPSRRDAVRLLAQNEAPVWRCCECDEAATQLCSECAYERDTFLCASHSEEHECDEDRLLPVVNSPRMGVCAYGL